MSGSDAVTVEITGLELFGRHGVHEAERQLGQRFVVDVRVRVEPCRATETDDLADTIDYAGLADSIAELVGGAPDRLLERLASRIADRALAEPGATGVAVTVRKPHVAIPHTVAETAVSVVRGRTP